MIKLILNPGQEERTYAFEKDEVVIGSQQTADLYLQSDSSKEIHVKIYRENEGYKVLNAANDPFVTLNGVSFWRKPIKKSDLLEIGRNKIRFEEQLAAQEAEEISPKVTVALTHVLDEAMHRRLEKTEMPPLFENPPFHQKTTSSVVSLIPKPKEHKKQEEPEAEKIYSIEELVKQVEELDPAAFPPKPQKPVPAASDMPIESSVKTAPLAKDYYLSEFDDESEVWTSEKMKQKPLPEEPAQWKTPVTLILIAAFIAFLIAVIIYIRATDRSDFEAIRAARGVSDVAMALTHAKLKQIKPTSQNWTDIEFLKNNLSSILGTDFTPFLNLDAHGQFTDSPYLLRIYTDTELNRFVVIAQPAPSLLQWLVPKYSIILDSRSMVLRKMRDLRQLNRLLTNHNPLDGSNGQEVGQLIDQGELIPLSSLSSRRRNEGYTAPKALGMLRPGAEQLIYNSPRYYPMGDNLLSHAIGLSDSASNSEDIALFQQQVQALAKLPHLVLYTSRGLESAAAAQRALTTFAPYEKLLVAYLTFANNGSLNGGHLLMTGIPEETAMVEKPVEMMEWRSPLEGTEGEVQQHPVYFKLLAIRQERQNALRPLSDQWISLITRHVNQPISQFNQELEELTSQFETADRASLKNMTEEIYQVYHEYSVLPVSKFMEYCRLVGLEPFVNQTLNLNAANSDGKHIPSPEEIAHAAEQISLSTNWEDLQAAVIEAVAPLNLNIISNSDLLNDYQQRIRTSTLRMIKRFILSPDSLPPHAFSAETRDMLLNIMNRAWINDPEQRQFFLTEFNHLSAEAP